MDEFEEGIKSIETTRDILREVINDMTLSCDELDKCVKFLRDPFRMIMSENIGKELDTMTNKAQLYVLMAANKMQALIDFMNNGNKEEE